MAFPAAVDRSATFACFGGAHLGRCREMARFSPNHSMKPTAQYGVRLSFMKRESLSPQFSLATGGGLSLSR